MLNIFKTKCANKMQIRPPKSAYRLHSLSVHDDIYLTETISITSSPSEII